MSDKQEFEVRSRFTYWWKYWQMPTCNTPVFEHEKKAISGDHYKAMNQYCNDVYEDIMQVDMCPKHPLEGGACIVVYQKQNFEVSKKTPYIFTKDKRGYNIAFKLNDKGKKRRIKYQKAKNLQKQLMEGRKKRAKKKKNASFKVLKFNELGAGCSQSVTRRT